MKKPVLPIADEWITFVNITDPKRLLTPFVLDVNELEGCHINDLTLLGTFGRFLAIRFQNTYFLIPNIFIQWILWSADNRLANQFSDMELHYMTGATSINELNNQLIKERSRLIAVLSKPQATTETSDLIKTKKLDSVIEHFMASSSDDCPEPIFFEEQ